MSSLSTEARPSGRHPVNIGHLVMGLAFLGLVGVWALIEGDVVTGDDIRWLLPVPWIVAGIAGLTASAVTGARRYSVRSTGWVNVPPPASADDLNDPNDTAYPSHPGENPGETQDQNTEETR